tara:strand:+ start:2253 stop:2702 length:450 start_codon:yes stop_codon:yes gene_type:complete
MIKTLIGFAGMIGMMLWAMEFNVGNFVNVPSIMIVFGLTFFGLLASGYKLIAPLSAVIDKHADEDQFYDASDTFSQAGSFSMAAGWVGVLIGLVLMLVNLEDPAAIGPAMAICLLTALYGTVLKYFIFNPLSDQLAEKGTAIFNSRVKK